MTVRDYTIATAPPNRKEFAEAFGANQSAVRRLETITLDVTKNLPEGIDTNTVAIQFLSMSASSAVALPAGRSSGSVLSMADYAEGRAPGGAASIIALIAAQSSAPIPHAFAQAGVFAAMESAGRVAQPPGNYQRQQPLVVFSQTSTTGTSLTTGTSANVASIPLAAGTWDLSGVVVFNAAASTVTQQIAAGVSTTSGTLGAPDTQQKFQEGATGGSYNMAVPLTRVVLANAATVYLIAQATFTTSTMTADGYIKARPGI